MLHQAKHLAGFLPFSSEPLVDEAGDHLWDGTVEAGKVEHEGVVRVRRGELLGAACADYPAGERADLGAIPKDDRMIIDQSIDIGWITFQYWIEIGVIKAPFQPLVQLGVVAIVVGSCEDDDGVKL